MCEHLKQKSPWISEKAMCNAWEKEGGEKSEAGNDVIIL